MKRLYLQEWETVSRQLGKSVRSYTNRFKRILLDLRSQEIGLETSFTSETIGYSSWSYPPTNNGWYW